MNQTKVRSQNVSLREITQDTLRPILKLSVTDAQAKFVASNAISLAQALFSPEAWYRGIYHNDEAVGFVMVYDESLRESPPAAPEVCIWRFMIDHRFQGRGIGKAALSLTVEFIKAKRVTSTLLVSYVPAEGSPQKFYEDFGFEPTGEIDEGEIVMQIAV